MNKTETPDTVHGRLLESVHMSGYTFERACAELDWLLDDNRWQRVGRGCKDINAFLATLDFSEFKIALEQRKKLAKRLAAIDASQRSTAKLLGVDKETVRADLGKRKAPGGNPPLSIGDGTEGAATSGGNPPAWFQTDADPSREAKRVARNEARAVERDQLREERPARSLPVGTFQLIYADPPWRYEHVATESRAIENQYPTMDLDAICGLTLPTIADDAVLFLWATSPKLAEAIAVIEAWCFSYRTCAVWDKEMIGMGYYFRQQHELLLVAGRGSAPVPGPDARPSSVIRDRRSTHSTKPTFVYDLLERMYPTFTEEDRIELFQRQPRAGWASWGNEPARAEGIA